MYERDINYTPGYLKRQSHAMLSTLSAESDCGLGLQSSKRGLSHDIEVPNLEFFSQAGVM